MTANAPQKPRETERRLRRRKRKERPVAEQVLRFLYTPHLYFAISPFRSFPVGSLLSSFSPSPFPSRESPFSEASRRLRPEVSTTTKDSRRCPTWFRGRSFCRSVFRARAIEGKRRKIKGKGWRRWLGDGSAMGKIRREKRSLGRKFLCEVEHAWAHSGKLGTGRVKDGGARGPDGVAGGPEEPSSASTRYQALLKVHKHREVKRELWP